MSLTCKPVLPKSDIPLSALKNVFCDEHPRMSIPGKSNCVSENLTRLVDAKHPCHPLSGKCVRGHVRSEWNLRVQVAAPRAHVQTLRCAVGGSSAMGTREVRERSFARAVRLDPPILTSALAYSRRRVHPQLLLPRSLPPVPQRVRTGEGRPHNCHACPPGKQGSPTP